MVKYLRIYVDDERDPVEEGHDPSYFDYVVKSFGEFLSLYHKIVADGDKIDFVDLDYNIGFDKAWNSWKTGRDCCEVLHMAALNGTLSEYFDYNCHSSNQNWNAEMINFLENNVMKEIKQ